MDDTITVTNPWTGAIVKRTAEDFDEATVRHRIAADEQNQVNPARYPDVIELLRAYEKKAGHEAMSIVVES